MEDKDKLAKKAADWAGFFAGAALLVANPFGIIGAVYDAMRAAWNVADDRIGKFREFVGKHIALPLAKFYIVSIVLADVLLYATNAAAGDAMADHWSAKLLFGAMVGGPIIMGAHIADLILVSRKYPARTPIVQGIALFGVVMRAMMYAGIIRAISASSELAMIPSGVLAGLVLVMTYAAALVVGWILNQAIVLLETGLTAAASPLAIAPGTDLAWVAKMADIFKNEAWKSVALKVAVDEATILTVFMVLVSFAPSPAMAALIGPPVVVTGAVMGTIAKLNGRTAEVRARRELFVWRLYVFTAFGLFIARLAALVPVVGNFFSSLLGSGETAVIWSTKLLKGKFENPMPSLEVWHLVLALIITTIIVILAFMVSKNWNKWGKLVFRGPTSAALLALLVFGTMNAKCGLLSDDGKKEEAKQEQKTEQRASDDSKKPNDTPPPPATHQPAAKPVATPPARTAPAPVAKDPNEMSRSEVNASIADIAAGKR